jgi:hypothetical protein
VQGTSGQEQDENGADEEGVIKAEKGRSADRTQDAPKDNRYTKRFPIGNK